MAVAHLWDLAVLAPGEFDADVVATAVAGGTAAPGGVTQGESYDFGGLVRVVYGGVQIDTRAQHLYWNKLAARLNGSIRDILVPIPTDRIEPVGIAATLDGAHAAKATEVAIAVTAGAALQPGMWFGIEHAAAGSRVYGIASIVSATDLGGGAVDYVVAISPPLRGDGAAAAALSFDRPAGLMTLAPGQSMAWRFSSNWQARPSVTFIEAEF